LIGFASKEGLIVGVGAGTAIVDLGLVIADMIQITAVQVPPIVDPDVAAETISAM
jgi:hypothetical protein